ncbi:MAG: 30S ribosomal protein S2 [Parcubacteria group bacterium]
MNIPSLEAMMQAGVHFGHRTSKWHPKMKPYIYTERNGVHVINLEETVKFLEPALEFVKKIVRDGGLILFLGTKKQARTLIKEAAESCKMPYVINRWLGGTLTNSSTILSLVKKLRKLKADRDSGELLKYTKKEQLEFAREIERLDRLVGGMEMLDKVPNAMFIVDIRDEKTAVAETITKKIPTVALCDTNVNPELVAYPIPSNDDATKALKLMINLVAEAVKEAQAEMPAVETKK